MKRILSVVSCLLLVVSLSAQETFPINGVPNHNHNYYAFTNAKIFVDYQTVIASGTLVIKDGLIIYCAEKVEIPKGAVVMDMKGRSIYPSFVDPFSTYGMPEIKPQPRGGFTPQMESNAKGAYNWNQAVHPEVDAVKLFAADQKSADELRKLGYGSVMTFSKDGIARGTGVFVTLADENENKTVLFDKSAALYSFEKGTSTQEYPSSLMGSIALLRQTYMDAQWYAQTKNNPEYNISLDAFNKIQSLPQIFEIHDKLSALRADIVGDEFKVQYIIKGCGNEYQRMDDIKATNAKFIIPLNFPAAFDLEDPYDAAMVSLEDMKHWEMAPLNPAAFEQNFIPFAFTASDLKDKKDLWKNIRKAIEYGLSEKTALKALTYTPAELVGAQTKVGSLKAGMIANFIVTSGNLFDEKNIIYQNWVQGNIYVINPFDLIDVRGTYDVKVGDKSGTLKVIGDLEKPKATIELGDTNKIPVTMVINTNLINLTYSLKDDNKGLTRLNGTISTDGAHWKGKGQLVNGDWVEWNANLKTPFAKVDKKDTLKTKPHPTLDDVLYPFCGYGQAKTDSTSWKKFMNRWNAVLIKNATVWTNEAEGILQNKDVLITDGKIVRIGDNLEVPKTVSVLKIDGTGKFLTAGIVDEHSHIATSEGTNEGTQSSSAEVRIGDVIDCEDISIYRSLSGGVTAAQILHGSANAIGGQSGLIKLKWGAPPEEMKIKNADGFIKFALGENVKQSNWGDFSTVRFPQSRMGVEQVYYDYFTRAKEYQAKWDAFNGLKDKSKSVSPRRDIELEALSEILNKKRFITCHSYVQSEINMLMHVGDSMGFQVNTFTHILEGYKMADKMKQRNIYASTFADWWAYKVEVQYAIPYNAAIMYNMGIPVCINSDDAEMERRLNQEAAKTVKYGHVPEQDAFKMVTLNPSMALHLDKRMGSIKVGKDGDVVLWTDNPLSIYAKVDKTIIEGVVYYDAEKDKKLRDDIRKERARLIQKMLAEKSGGAPLQKPVMRKPKYYQCDDIENYGAFTNEETK